MKKLNEGQRFLTDPLEAKRTAYLVEVADVGKDVPGYLGQSTYTLTESDVGRLVEVVINYSPGFVSWRFGSIFCDLRKQYPDPKPYVGVE